MRRSPAQLGSRGEPVMSGQVTHVASLTGLLALMADMRPRRGTPLGDGVIVRRPGVRTRIAT